MDFDNVIKKRASIRKFSSKKPKIENITQAIEAANMAPAPGNLQSLRFIIIENPETIEKIAEACQQSFVSQAHFLVVICSDPTQVERNYERRAKRYIKHHVGAAVENFLLKLIDLGLDSCWVGAFSDTTIKNLLRIPDNVDVEVVLPVGYKLVTDHKKQRNKQTLENRVFFETWKNKQKVPYRKVGEH